MGTEEESTQPQPGFERPQPPRDDWVAGLYERYELGATPSMAAIEPVAHRLWANPHTRGDAVELVLGRRVDATEFRGSQLGLICLSVGDPDMAFGMLLLAREIDLDDSEAS